jgi:lipid II:glycine glycyltransferase (peptidoglycan interpeptide bridge formation enzyme)
MHVQPATNASAWDSFLQNQCFRPFLQSWTMGEVYRDIGEEPVRVTAVENSTIVGICQAIVVPARRGKHVAVLYGPVGETRTWEPMIESLKEVARERQCSFLRISPFLPEQEPLALKGTLASPLHLLAEHLSYIPLTKNDLWNTASDSGGRAAQDHTELGPSRGA